MGRALHSRGISPTATDGGIPWVPSRIKKNYKKNKTRKDKIDDILTSLKVLKRFTTIHFPLINGNLVRDKHQMSLEAKNLNFKYVFVNEIIKNLKYKFF